VSVSIRTNGDAALYTDSGVVLYDKGGADGELCADQRLYAGHYGKCGLYRRRAGDRRQFRDALKSGKIAGLAELRDNATVTLPEPARRSRASLDRRLQGERVSRLPRRCRTCPVSSPIPARRRCRRVRPCRSASPARSRLRPPSIRPRAAAPTSYGRRDQRQCRLRLQHRRNAGFSTRLQQLIDNMDAPQPFDATAQGKPSGGVIDFASSSASWIETSARVPTTTSSTRNTLLDRSNSALSNVNGVNMDDEMSMMLQVERTYSASSKLISTVDTC